LSVITIDAIELASESETIVILDLKSDSEEELSKIESQQNVIRSQSIRISGLMQDQDCIHTLYQKEKEENATLRDQINQMKLQSEKQHREIFQLQQNHREELLQIDRNHQQEILQMEQKQHQDLAELSAMMSLPHLYALAIHILKRFWSIKKSTTTPSISTITPAITSIIDFNNLSDLQKDILKTAIVPYRIKLSQFCERVNKLFSQRNTEIHFTNLDNLKFQVEQALLIVHKYSDLWDQSEDLRTAIIILELSDHLLV
jgi:hypothetical protein